MIKHLCSPEPFVLPHTVAESSRASRLCITHAAALRVGQLSAGWLPGFAVLSTWKQLLGDTLQINDAGAVPPLLQQLQLPRVQPWRFDPTAVREGTFPK